MDSPFEEAHVNVDTKLKSNGLFRGLANRRTCVALLVVVLSLGGFTYYAWKTHAFLDGGAGGGSATAFNDFVKTYGRSYATPQEEKLRAAIFQANYDQIEATNAKRLPYRLAVNEFADMTAKEFAAGRFGLLGTSRQPGFAAGGLPHLGTHLRRNSSNGSLLSVQGEVDWVAAGAVTPPKNQLECGSCWSFSTTGALEGAWQILTGQLVSLSEQNLMDCSTENNGCGGGNFVMAFAELQYYKVGLCTEASYPYEAQASSCRAATCNVGLPQGAVVGFMDVPIEDEEALMGAVAQQPISVAIQAAQRAIQFYQGGIITRDCTDYLDHAVLLVGYGWEVENYWGWESKVKYWKVKNSWGTSWGEHGFFRIVRGVRKAHRECGIKSMAAYPVLSHDRRTTGPSQMPAVVV